MKLCDDCNKFIKEHPKVKTPNVYIGSTFLCKKCKLQFEVITLPEKQKGKIAEIWKLSDKRIKGLK
jgi:hypothetical protein